jgi:outer membrane protein assembly factor BamB
VTDAELLTLVQTKAPEELAADEIAQLRSRLAESETLRTALFDTLQMETYLASALGPSVIHPDKIVARAEQMRDERLRWWTLGGIGLGCVLFLLLGGAILRTALRTDSPLAVAPSNGPTEEPAEEANAQGEKPSADDRANDAPESSVSSSPMPTPPMPPGDSPMVVPAEGVAGAENVVPPAAETMLPKPPPPVEPWHEVVSMPQEELPGFYDVCFQEFAYRSYLPSRDDLGKWFQGAPGQRFALQDATTKRGRCARIDGVARLKAPWPADGGLRFAIEEYNRLAIHAWHGEQGVMLVYHEDQRNRWTAYATTRKPGQPKSETMAITASDDERARRAEMRYGGPLELRHVDGELLLLRGDVPLIRAPLAGPPGEVYFDGKAAFEGIALVRTRDAPPSEPSDEAEVRHQVRPADLAWSDKVSEGATFEKLPEGGVRLVSKEPMEPTYLYAPLPGVGLREVIFELREVTPGFGVMLGHDDGQIRHLVRVVRNTKSKQLNVSYRGPDDFHEGDLPGIAEKPEIVCQDRLWIKLLHGLGVFKWWVSADGQHWSIGDQVPEPAFGRITSLGITTCRSKKEAAGTLASITVRELSAINGLAERQLVEQAPLPGQETTLEAWLANTSASTPAGVKLNDWRRACAVRTLGFGPSRELSQKLMETLLDDAASRLTPQERLAVLQEVMLVETDPRDNVGWSRGYLSRIYEVGRELGEQSGLPFSSVRRVLMQAPTWSHHALPVAGEGLPEQELVHLLQRGENRQALAFCDMLRLYRFQENRPLLAWGEAIARRDAGRITSETARMRDSWRHPLIEELNKEVYNYAADLHAIVESGAVDDASRMIASLDADRGGGLTPSGSDRELFVSLSVAIKLAVQQQPALRTSLSEKLASLAQLRVRQAIAGGDEAVISLAATQFECTPAAAQAYLWLGDRALQNGWFTRALADYRRAEASATPSLQRQLAPRARLAAAMLGLDHGSAATDTVSLGELNMAAAEFEALVAEMRGRGAGTLQGSTATSEFKLPAPVELQPHNRARLDGPIGQNPHDDGARFISQWQIDFAGRQIATAVEGDVLYVSNRFQVAAYNAVNGSRIWQSQTPEGELRRGQDWPLIAMQPLVTPQAIYARQLYGKSPSVCAFEKAGGKLLWTRPGTDNEWWVSDPLFVQGQLLVLSILRDGGREMQLRLVSLDPFTGDVLVQRRLAGLRDSWQHYKTCEVARLDDGLIAAVAGMTLNCDADGSVRWIRRHLLLPYEERPDWIRQYFAPPLVVDDRVFVLQPGVESLECLDAATGRQHWSYEAKRPLRILGRSDELLYLETESGIVALRHDSGELAWQHREPLPRLTAALANEQHVVYLVNRGDADKPKTPELVWLDAATGEWQGAGEFAAWQDADPRTGPLVSTHDRLWTFFSKGKEPTKDLVELVAGALLEQPPPRGRSPWQRTLPTPLLDAVTSVAPDWELVSGYPRSGAESKGDWQGETGAAVVLARAETPLALVSQRELPADKRPKLTVQVGHEANATGEFEVRVDGESVFTQDWKPENGNRWESLSFPLTKYSGKPVAISLIYRPTTGADHAIWIKTAEVVLE